jgi:hypothetical protein
LRPTFLALLGENNLEMAAGNSQHRLHVVASGGCPHHVGCAGDILYNYSDGSISVRNQNEWMELEMRWIETGFGHPCLPDVYFGVNEVGDPIWIDEDSWSHPQWTTVSEILDKFIECGMAKVLEAFPAERLPVSSRTAGRDEGPPPSKFLLEVH